MKNVSSSIENLESEAEKSLEQARKQATGILAAANEESQKITSSPLDVDEIKAECKRIVETAQQESDQLVRSSGTEAAKLKTTASEKIPNIVTRMTRLITEA